MTLRAALITPPGPAGIAVVRLLGPKSPDLINKIFHPHKQSNNLSRTGRNLIMGSIQDNEEIIDHVIIAYNLDNEIMDINCHGGPRIVQRLLLYLQKHNVEITSWKELNPVDSIAEEIELTLPQAKTRMAAQAIAAQYPQGLTSWIKNTMESIKTRTTPLEVIRQNIRELLDTYPLARKLFHGALVVVTGPVNAGKSTLVNTLSGKTQSIISELPGTTRDWTGQLIDIQGIPVQIIDTAGRRQPADDLEHHSLIKADEIIKKSDLAILVVEAGPNCNELPDQHRHDLPPQTNTITVVNKIDLINLPTNPDNHIYLSALTGENIDKLCNAISDQLGFAHFNPLNPLIFTDRQYILLQTVMETDSPEDCMDSLQSLIGDI
ncbi:MAG: GTP-binding protein [Sedimentisphaerales bacterium]|nr:GTP-binding protein [Sedimentisphaerales bacterium]